MRIASWGHAVFALTMIGLGLVGLISGGFTATWSGVPSDMPLRDALAYLCAVISLVSGAGLLWQRTAAVASRVLLTWLLVWLLVVRLPHLVVAPATVDSWWGSGDTAVMVAGAWVLFAWFAGERKGHRLDFAGGEQGLHIARVFYGLAMIPFGAAHFINLRDTAGLVPAWLPWHVTLAFLTGCAFIAAGIAVLTGVYARLASALMAWQLGLFTLLVWAPMVAAGPNAFQWSEFVDSWALTAGAWMVADSYRRTPWFAVGSSSIGVRQTGGTE